MRYTVIGVIDGRRMEMPVEASGFIEAMHLAEAQGMVVVEVRAPEGSGFITTGEGWGSPPPKKPRTDSPLLCFGLGFLIPIIGLLVAFLKLRDDKDAAGAAIVGAVLGFLIWGGVISGL